MEPIIKRACFYSFNVCLRRNSKGTSRLIEPDADLLAVTVIVSLFGEWPNQRKKDLQLLAGWFGATLEAQCSIFKLVGVGWTKNFNHLVALEVLRLNGRKGVGRYIRG